MATLEVTACSQWYGNVVAVNDVTVRIGPGVTGLLGPNGAGKSTLIHLLAGFLAPSAGTVTLDGAAIWKNTQVYRVLGLVPEREATFDYLTGRQLVVAAAELHGLRDAGAAAQRALTTVAMHEAQDRRVGEYSKGMKQRVKMAAALVHDPQVLLLDEPFNGMDPRQRLHLIALLRTMGDEGRTVLFSSHILEEVEQLATHVEVLVAGRHAASGDYREIRRLMTDRPHQYTIVSSDNRALAAALIADRSTAGVGLETQSLRVQATEFVPFAELLPRVAQAAGVRLYEVTPMDESLESVFAYLV
ncbi:MAG: ABC transporter ATP-binding protein, partial [Micrococcales bacterium]|nr:ABC transporter ATP-binding protein [Micrococcales bacterium]